MSARGLHQLFANQHQGAEDQYMVVPLLEFYFAVNDILQSNYLTSRPVSTLPEYRFPVNISTSCVTTSCATQHLLLMSHNTCFIEAICSVRACQVRISLVFESLQVKQADELENILAKRFLRFLSMRAESFQVLRRKPVEVKTFDKHGSHRDRFLSFFLYSKHLAGTR